MDAPSVARRCASRRALKIRTANSRVRSCELWGSLSEPCRVRSRQLCRDRHPPAGPERTIGDFETRRCLLPLELCAVHEGQHAVNRFRVESRRDDFVGWLLLFDGKGFLPTFRVDFPPALG